MRGTNAGIELPADIGTAERAAKIIERFPKFDIPVDNIGVFEPKSFDQLADENGFSFFVANVMGEAHPAFILMTKTAQWPVSRGLAETTASAAVTADAVRRGRALLLR